MRVNYDKFRAIYVSRSSYFKTDQLFHSYYLGQLEDCIEQNSKLTRNQKDKLIKPLYRFYEDTKKNYLNHNGKEKNIIMPVKEVEQ
tara:strand:- start:60 stop:317 length:258 start_codon:yes stop_codon:yes gene_type:complete